MRRIRSPVALEGEAHPPGDKSISHRAVILNSIASGRATITNFPPSADCRATVSCMRALGASIEERGPGELLVTGAGPGGLSEPGDVLDAANSATAMRLLAGLLAPQPFLSIITGDRSLRSRPMGRVIQPLRLMGARIWGRHEDTRAPLVIRGTQLKAISYHLPVASAQVKSALLLAGLHAQGTTVIQEPAPSRDHTERLLKAMGACIEMREGVISLSPTLTPLRPVDVDIPGDISAASFWLVAAILHPRARVRLRGVGINPTRSGILEVLHEMGANLQVEGEEDRGGEPVADLLAESSSLRGVELGGEIIPRVIDELPLVALAGALARGVTVIREAAELRVKETDRIAATAQELTRLGAVIEELPDGLVVHGGSRLQGAVCHSHGDHRLAMTLAVAGLLAGGETVIEDAGVSEVSYPGFWEHLAQLTAAPGPELS